MPGSHRRRRQAALFVVHGIGAQRRSWAHDFVMRVRKALTRLDPAVELVPAVAYWAPITERPEAHQLARLRQAIAGGPFGAVRWRFDAWGWLRDFVVKYGGDVVAYQSPAHVGRDLPIVYREVHECLNAALQGIVCEVVRRTGQLPARPVPLVTVAHSLGSVIFSDFTYDLQRAPGVRHDFPEHYRLSLAGLFTIGSPLALYALRYPTQGVDRPIALAPGGEWVNAFYRQDVIGHPLRDTGPAYKEAVREDWVLPARWWWPWYLTPLSHMAYWNDRQFVRRVAQALARVADPAVG